MSLKIATTDTYNPNVRVAAAVFFKNCVKKHWDINTSEYALGDDDRKLIKERLVDLMLGAPRLVQKQLSEAMAIVCKFDFPQKWEQLLPHMINKLKTNDFSQIARVLETLVPLFERYRYELKSDTLWKEISYVLKHFQKPLLHIFKQTLKAMKEAPPQHIEIVVTTMKLVCQIFFLLNVQDIPEFFEDTMDEWMGPFQKLLDYSNSTLESKGDPDEPTQVQHMKAQILLSVKLYADKYEEEFSKWVEPFVKTTWGMLNQVNEEAKHDPVVTAAIKFLNSVVKKPWNKRIFDNEQALNSICRQVVVRQLKLRESDVDMFNFESVEYVRRDIEGSDVDTRRRAAVDLIRGLCLQFEEVVTNILKSNIGDLMKQYAQDKNNWAAKDVAMYTMMALTVKGETRRQGVVETNPYVNVIDFFKSSVLPELRNADAHPIIRADCLKFIATFRNQLPAEAYSVILPEIVKHLNAQEYVVHTYAASAIERLLFVKDKGKPRFTKEMIAPKLKPLLVALFDTLKHEDSQENSYVMRAILRVCSVAQEATAPLAPIVIEQVKTIIQRVAKNPRVPRFNHFLFETIACLVRNICRVKPELASNFEGALFGFFQQMLGMETCTEFGSYVFIIISQLLSYNKGVPDMYQKLFPSLVHPDLWKDLGNAPAIVRLLKQYLMKQDEFVWKNLTAILGVFQKLLSVKKVDHCGMDLMVHILTYVPLPKLQPLMGEVLNVLFRRLSSKKTPKFCRLMIMFFSNFIIRYGMKAAVSTSSTVQPDIFAMFIERIWIEHISMIGGPDRELVAVALTIMLTKSPEMLGAKYKPLWGKCLNCIVTLFEDKTKLADGKDNDLLDLAETGFQSSYSPLAFAPEEKLNPLEKYPNPPAFFIQSLAEFSTKNPNVVPGIVSSSLSQKHQKALEVYVQKAGVQIV
jgi:exportin-2 (importin alpha re-exporter)